MAVETVGRPLRRAVPRRAGDTADRHQAREGDDLSRWRRGGAETAGDSLSGQTNSQGDLSMESGLGLSLLWFPEPSCASETSRPEMGWGWAFQPLQLSLAEATGDRQGANFQKHPVPLVGDAGTAMSGQSPEKNYQGFHSRVEGTAMQGQPLH